MFICNHCPFVKHVRVELARLGRDFLAKDVSIVAINSNDFARYPGDSPERMKEEAETWEYDFPYVVDADQSVAKAYRATCTPDFFLFDANKETGLPWTTGCQQTVEQHSCYRHGSAGCH